METLALLPLVTIAINTGLPTVGCYATNTVGYHACNSTGVVSISMELFNHGYVVTTRVLHSNNGPRSNTSQYYGGSWKDRMVGVDWRAIVNAVINFQVL
jgi:hypothetical protein